MSERVLEFGEALACVLAEAAAVRPLEATTVALEDALGRVLAEDVRADRDQPPFARSTRDGFAVRSADGAAPRRVTGTLRAGEEWRGGVVRPGDAVEIMTGAALPEGTDAVVMVEHVAVEAGTVSLLQGRGVVAGLNVVAQGSEAKAGVVVLRAGSVIGAAEIAVAASSGCGELAVWERPQVAVVATGDELVELGAGAPGAMEIWNSNGPALRAAVRAEGGWADRIAAATDDRQVLRERIAMGSAADLLVLSGGVSMGKYDLVEEILREAGAEFFFTGVRMQPGKPVVFGRLPKRGGVGSDTDTGAPQSRWTFFFGLPGNPVSTQVTFALFVAPLLRALAGRAEIAPRFVEATLAEAIEGSSDGGSGRTRFLPAEVGGDWRGVTVRPVSWQGSGDVAANVRGNAYVVLPSGIERWTAGETVRVLLR